MATLPFSVPALARGRHAIPRLLLPLGLGIGWGWALPPAGFGQAVGQPLAPAPAPAPASAPTPAPGDPAGLPRSRRLTGNGLPAVVAPSPPEAAGAAAPAAPLTEVEFAALLKLDDLDQLNQACARVLQDDTVDRLRLLQTHLLDVRPAPQPLAVVLANAEVLLSCRAPHAALTVLDRFGPGPGPGRVQWLLLQWRAANAAMDHRRAALALDRLSGGREARLNQLTLPIRRQEDGTVLSRPAVEVLAGHLEARGFGEAAGQLLLRQAAPGVSGAERLGRAVTLLSELPAAEREAILETALNQAAAAGAWSLVTDLLDAQAALPSPRAVARRLRLSPRLDDAYGEWLLRQGDPASQQRARQLERQLRSPRDPGGHAPPSPQPPAP